MNSCKVCHKARVTESQYRRREEYPSRGLKVKRDKSEREHGVRGYWNGCRCSRCVDAKRAYMRDIYRQQMKGNVSDKQEREAVQLKLFVKNQIRLLTKTGASRETIKRETKAPWDVITDTLAEMWDTGELTIKRRNERPHFYLKRAA